ncbi:MAG: putative bifunctional diguanylate cyclase/phosphodiesterase [Sulfuriferula sp.]
MIARRPDLSLGASLKIGFTLLLLLLIGLTVTGLVAMTSINQSMERVVKENNVKIDLAHDMRYALSNRAIIMHSMPEITDAFDQQDAFDRFNQDAAIFIKARNQIMKLKLNAAEENILASIRQITIKTQPLVVHAISQAMNGENAEARTLIADQIVPLQQQLSFRIDELVELQKQEAALAAQKMADTYANTRLLLLLFGGGAALLGLLIAVVVIRHTSRQAAQLQHQAMYDSLTKLPNRVLFADRLQQAILIGRREKQPFALIAMDLDRFKEINDTLGHHAGDQVLQHVAACIRNCLRESDTVARMGGDEFAILLAPVSDLDGALATARKILKALEKPAYIAGQQIEIGASFGIALFPEHGEDAEGLMREADTAMYLAKQAHSGYQVYSKDTSQETDDHLALQGELRHAIAHNELVLHFQPKIDFSSGRISGVEALVRWQHPQHGLLAPDHFIPMAEQTGLIKPLTCHVLRSALRQCEEWQRAGLDLSMSVNISAINIQDPEFPEQVAKLLKEFTVPPARLELDVAETALMSEPVRAMDCIKKLSALGLQIAIDDFGTGYASLSYLKEMLVAKIKIDKSFVKNMVVNHNDAVIVRSTVELGHNLGLKVVAEGVESQAVWDSLKALGCDDAQGYHMGRPLPADEFSEWLRQSPWGLKASK